MRLEAIAAWGLGLWAVGVQVHEALATAGAVVCAICALGIFHQSSSEAKKAGLKTWWPVVALFAAGLILPLMGGQLPTGSGLARWSDWLLIPTAAVLVRRVEPRVLRRIAIVTTGVFLGSCAVAAAQHFGLWPPEEAWAALEWARLPFYRVYELVPGREDRWMAGGLLLHRLKFAHVGAVTVVLMSAATLSFQRAKKASQGPFGSTKTEVSGTHSSGPSSVGSSLWRSASAIGFASVLIFPHARAASVALVIALLIIGWKATRQPWVGVAIIVLGAGLSLSMPSVRDRFARALSGDEPGDRTSLRNAGILALKEHPLTGLGQGRFLPRHYVGPDAPESVLSHSGKTHNQLLTIAVEGGIISALLFLIVLATLLKRGWFGSGALLGVAVLLVVLGVLHDPLFHPEVSLAFMLAFGASSSRPGL